MDLKSLPQVKASLTVTLLCCASHNLCSMSIPLSLLVAGAADGLEGMEDCSSPSSAKLRAAYLFYSRSDS